MRNMIDPYPVIAMTLAFITPYHRSGFFLHRTTAVDFVLGNLKLSYSTVVINISIRTTILTAVFVGVSIGMIASSILFIARFRRGGVINFICMFVHNAWTDATY